MSALQKERKKTVAITPNKIDQTQNVRCEPDDSNWPTNSKYCDLML